ncbi:MAG: DUF4278 domain-containing protein [Coleofasciculus sp.]
MSLLFIIPLGIFLVTAYLFKQLANEMAYLAAAIALVSLVVTLCLAPWQIQFLLLILVIFSNYRRSCSSSQPVTESSLPDEDNVKLVYRGVNYDLSPAQVDVTEDEVIGKYRGQALRIHHLVTPPATSTLLPLKYRGVSVSDHKSLIPVVKEQELTQNSNWSKGGRID